ncbi:MAG: VWA domain-containing protein [Candidatus Woesebacteria bacterium]|jgi:Ca-activated chloride channel family protein
MKTDLPKQELDTASRSSFNSDLNNSAKEEHLTWKKKLILAAVLFPILLILAFIIPKKLDISRLTDGLKFGEKIDDWQFEAQKEETNGRMGGVFSTSKTAVEMAAPAADFADESIGLSTGGAKDINNFRENIENNYLPLPTDITYEGLFYDYFFDTGESYECEQLFCPSYNMAVTKDPFSGQEEHYLAVGLNSGMKETNFERKKLNLVVVLDISGSMSSSFKKYYYDQSTGSRRLTITPIPEDEEEAKSKMEVANESIVALLDHLEPDDRFGMVLFDNTAYLAKPLRYIGETRMDSLKKHILEIKPQGGTNMAAGMKEGLKLLEEFKDVDQDEYENRIIFLTDAMPNTGETSEDGLLGMSKSNAANKIYSTFIGIGVDFNTELIEYITKIKGANYYSVHSAADFQKRMDDEFEYMVTPLVFDLKLELESAAYEIEKVYGSPEANEATGEIMKINTLFPSSKEGGETKGGLVLLKLKKKPSATDSVVKLKVSYQDRSDKTGGEEVTAELSNQSAEFFDNTGMRKGVLLARYANLIKNWINDERKAGRNRMIVDYSVSMEKGIALPEPIDQLGQWERQSMTLRVSGQYRELFKEFRGYFIAEIEAIGDDSLEREVGVLEKLSR